MSMTIEERGEVMALQSASQEACGRWATVAFLKELNDNTGNRYEDTCLVGFRFEKILLWCLWSALQMCLCLSLILKHFDYAL